MPTILAGYIEQECFNKEVCGPNVRCCIIVGHFCSKRVTLLVQSTLKYNMNRPNAFAVLFLLSSSIIK
jgi:hypothetical protein